MKEFISLFTLGISFFKFFKNYFDGKRVDYYFAIFFQLLIASICLFVFFIIDFLLFSKIHYFDSVRLILILVEGTLFAFTIVMYGSTYGIAINHFVLYKDKEDRVFERIGFTNPFNKENIKVKSEQDLAERKNKENRIYDYFDEYQIESFKYIDKDSKEYIEYAYQVYKGVFKRMFYNKSKITK
ncbi:hypothetical protein [Staphylococcus warneri]|jgi:hypothetical protein|uniref:hypothetical protein n=1 Tax=Staphylococcus warneri TaxID=1292 RepID=UPI00188911B7|nr:hypothetical protein [Staphylococcus warneri]MBF2265078.1 hypothetical protein [Staphylococcus warneri]MBF2267517.1 hypothetical protein [Staphylococcus warneri]MBF2272143.1 hypothetical protein [Staphylococcus warneri]MCF7595902.1 hypothetical protein [Staphylococcus warneri]